MAEEKGEEDSTLRCPSVTHHAQFCSCKYYGLPIKGSIIQETWGAPTCTCVCCSASRAGLMVWNALERSSQCWQAGPGGSRRHSAGRWRHFLTPTHCCFTKNSDLVLYSVCHIWITRRKDSPRHVQVGRMQRQTRGASTDSLCMRGNILLRSAGVLAI